MKFKDTKIIKKLLKARLKFRLKSKAFLAEEVEYQNDLAALKQAVQDGLGRSYKEREGLLPFTKNKFYPLIGETLYASNIIPYTLQNYIKAKPPVKQIIDSTEEEGRWVVEVQESGYASSMVAVDSKIGKTFKISTELVFENSVCGVDCAYKVFKYKDIDNVFTKTEAELLWTAFSSAMKREEYKIKQAKRQALVELYGGS